MQCTKFEIFDSNPINEDWDIGAKSGLGWLRPGQSRSSAMSPFDRARTTVYLSLIETVFVLYRFRELT